MPISRRPRPPLAILLLLLVAPIFAEGGAAPGTMSNEEIISHLLATRPKGPRTLVMPPFFATGEDRSEEQGAQTTPDGLAAWRDTYAKDGEGEFSLRQYFAPLKSWKKKTPVEMLDDARQQISSRPGVILALQKNYLLDGCPGRSFIIRQPASGKVVRVDYLVVYPDLFVVSYTGTEAGLRSDKVTRFFASLRTVPTPPGTTP